MPKKLRIIIAEDVSDHVTLIVRELRRAGLELDYVHIQSEEGLRGALAAGGWDLMLADFTMPLLTGLDCIRIVRDSGSDMPVIIISGRMGEETAIAAMKAGAEDYLLKSNLSRLAGSIERALIVAEGRRARAAAEEEVRLVNRLLNTVLDVNQMVARATDRARLLQEACEILMKHGGFGLAWIGMADHCTGRVNPVARAGCLAGYLDKVAIRCDDTPEGRGPTGISIRTGKTVVSLDLEKDISFKPWLSAAIDFGITACGSFPIPVRGRFIGSINVYSANRAVFEEKMVRLLEDLAQDIGHALENLEAVEEKRAALSALRESEEKLRTIFESSMDGLFVIDMEGKYLDVNLNGCRMFGYSREEILSSDVSLLLFPEDARVREEKRKIWKKGAFLPEVRLRKKDGSEIWVEMSIVPFRVGGKEMVFGVKHDVTERKKAEYELKESEERFRQIFEQSEDAQIVLEAGTTTILDVNPSAVSLYGYSRQQLISEGVSLFIAPGERVRFEESVFGISSKNGFSIERMDTVRKDGERLIVSVRGQIISLKQGDMVYCTIRDITEMTRMAEESRFIQAKLIHANKMTSIGTLASGVAHEINNPNNFILFNSTLLTDAWADAMGILNEYETENGDFTLGGLPFSEMRAVIPELLSGITDGARRIKGIVDNLKDFSRTDKSGMDGEFDVNRAVMASASILSAQISKYTDNFYVSCEDGLPFVRGSAQKIEQVIINLIINALHALPGKERCVWVSTSFDAAETQVRITIRDEGAGMTRDLLERITEPFFTTKTDTGGTGLGLSISYSIIKEHRGSLEFESQPGKGTTVRVSLPAALESERRYS